MRAAAEAEFSGRSAWITGASRGVGLAVARAFKRQGARVAAFDLVQSPEIKAVCDTFFELDVSHFAAVEPICAKAAKRGFIPDVLVNNAGITRDGVVWKLGERDWDMVLDVNLKGAFHMTRATVPLMREHGGGAIVNISSINGLRGKLGQSNYAASKAGLIGFSKSVARETGKFGIRVNVVAPGMVLTEMAAALPDEVRARALEESLLGRLAQPEDIAEAVVFLASSRAIHITGQVLCVDGGQYI